VKVMTEELREVEDIPIEVEAEGEEIKRILIECGLPITEQNIEAFQMMFVNEIQMYVSDRLVDMDAREFRDYYFDKESGAWFGDIET